MFVKPWVMDISLLMNFMLSSISCQREVTLQVVVLLTLLLKVPKKMLPEPPLHKLKLYSLNFKRNKRTKFKMLLMRDLTPSKLLKLTRLPLKVKPTPLPMMPPPRKPPPRKPPPMMLQLKKWSSDHLIADHKSNTSLD